MGYTPPLYILKIKEGLRGFRDIIREIEYKTGGSKYEEVKSFCDLSNYTCLGI